MDREICISRCEAAREERVCDITPPPPQAAGWKCSHHTVEVRHNGTISGTPNVSPSSVPLLISSIPTSNAQQAEVVLGGARGGERFPRW